MESKVKATTLEVIAIMQIKLQYMSYQYQDRFYQKLSYYCVKLHKIVSKYISTYTNAKLKVYHYLRVGGGKQLRLQNMGITGIFMLYPQTTTP